MLKKHWKLISLMAVVCLALCIGAVATKQAIDTEKEVPDVVKKTILEQAGNGTIGEIEMETTDGRTVYEAEVTIDGQEVDILVAPDGTLLGKEIEDDDEDDDDEGDDDDDDDDEDEDEEEVSLDDVPEAVKAAAKGAVEGIALTEAEVEEEDGQTVYTLEGKANGKEYAIEVTADGKVLEVEEETEDDD